MADTNPKPVVFLAFANDRTDGARYLRNLPDEARRLRALLEHAQESGLCEVVLRQNSTLDEILDVFQNPVYRSRIVLFHYGGHANGYQLLLETAAGQPAAAHAGGLAAFLGQQARLQLVFLNGCSTQAQVQGLLAAGAPAVIATSQAIDDAAATAFAIRFYTALAGGETLHSAFAQAEGAARVAHGDTPRHLYAEGASPEMADRWPWTLYVRPGAEAVAQWDLPTAAGDLLFGLPPLPPRDLPASPYRYLDWYRQEDAELFFGRGRAIRDLYTRVTAADSPPLLLFYGQSGVGKSSLLAAGLLPRLQVSHTVVYLRREQAQGLLGTLTASPSPLCPSEPGLGWVSAERQAGKPLLVVLDQVEEVFTRPHPDLPDEMSRFLTALQSVFGDPAQRPQGKLILGFRKEWLAEVEKRLAEAQLARAKVFLERLDRRGVVDVVTGPAGIARLQRHYGLSVEEGLADEIAGDLLADPDSPVATTLQILLAKLWEKACERSHSRPRFEMELYQQLRRAGIALDAFLEQQLAALRQTHAHAVESGLELDLLALHTTDKGTAEQRRAEALAAAYPHHPDLPTLVQRSKDLYLLSDAAGDGGQSAVTRLAHDTLAPLVRHRYEMSDAPGQRARRILENRVVEWRQAQTGSPLDDADLALVEAGARGMRGWSADEARLVAASRQASQRRALQERNRRRITALALALFLLVGAVALWLGQTSRDAREREQQAVDARATEAALRGDEARARQTAEANEVLAGIRETEARAAQATAVVAQAETAALKDVIEVNRLAAEAMVSGAAGLPQRRLLLALEAIKLHPAAADPLPVAQSALHAALSATGGIALRSHEGAVDFVAFSPDGRWLATSGRYGAGLRLWDVRDSGVSPIVPPSQADSVWALGFAPNGKWLATGSDDGVARLWDTHNPNAEPILLKGHEDVIDTLAFSPNGRWLATGSWDTTARLWDMQDPTADPMVLRGQDLVHALGFSPDGRWLATGGYASRGETVWLWDVQNPGADPTVLRGHAGYVSTLAFSPDGRWLATGSGDSTVRLWEMQDLTADPVILTGHTDFVGMLAFSPDGAWLASTSGDRTVRLWEMQDPTAEPIVLSGHESPDTALAFSSDSRWLATGSTSLRLWEMQNPTAGPIMLSGHEGSLHAVAFSPDGAWLASGSEDTTARLWDMANRSADPVVLNGHEGSDMALGFSPDGRWLASGGYTSQGGIAHVWDMYEPMADPVVLHDPAGGINAVAFSPDGAWLATGSSDATAHVWNAHDITADPMLLRSHESRINALAFSPDGKWLATGSEDATVRLWNMQDLTTDPRVLRDDEYAISALAFSPDGKWLATGSRNNQDSGTVVVIGFPVNSDTTVRLWDMQDPDADPILLSEQHRYSVESLAFSPNGKWLAVSQYGDYAARLWDVQTPNADPVVLSGHHDYILAVVFSPDGRWLATGSDDDTVRLWDLQDLSRDPVVLSHTGSVSALAFSPDSRQLATGGSSSTPRLWRQSLAELVELACRTAGRNLTQAELTLYFPTEPERHRQTCPELPANP